jgi:photosystem II stability/assembly factor-like uncharacterized protein
MTRMKIVLLGGVAALALVLAAGCSLLPRENVAEGGGWYIKLRIQAAAASKGITVDELDVTGMAIQVLGPGEDVLQSIDWKKADGSQEYLVALPQPGEYGLEVTHFAERGGEPVQTTESASFEIRAMKITVIDVVPGGIGLIWIEGQGVPPSPALVAEYLFSGNTDDTSGNGHHGLIYDAIATSDRFGNPNSAYYFSNSFIEVSDPPGHQFDPNGCFTISLWANLADDSSLEHFPFIAQDEGGGSTNKWYFNYRTFDESWNLFNALSFHVNRPSMGGGIRVNSDPISLQLNTWHHVVLVRDGAIFRFYVDALAAGSSTSDVVIPEVDSPLRIGYAEETEYLIGSADDVRIYNYALTAEQISGLFHEGGWTGTLPPYYGPAIYAGTASGLSVLANGSTSWTTYTSANGLLSDDINGMYVSGSNIYLVGNSGLSISTDGGSSWSTYTTADGLGGGPIYGVYASGSTIYVGTFGGGLSISTDGGSSWSTYTTANGLGGDSVRDVYASGSTIYAGTDGGLSISTDGGSSWTNCTTANGLASNVVWGGVHASGSNIYAATFGGGLSVSTDGGSSWTNYTTANGLASDEIHGMFVLGSTIYAATYGTGLSVSTDGGSTWTTYTTANGLASNLVFRVYDSGSAIYVGTEGGISISTDGGSSWTNYTTANGLASDVVWCVHAQ